MPCLQKSKMTGARNVTIMYPVKYKFERTQVLLRKRNYFQDCKNDSSKYKTICCMMDIYITTPKNLSRMHMDHVFHNCKVQPKFGFHNSSTRTRFRMKYEKNNFPPCKLPFMQILPHSRQPSAPLALPLF